MSADQEKQERTAETRRRGEENLLPQIAQMKWIRKKQNLPLINADDTDQKDCQIAKIVAITKIART